MTELRTLIWRFYAYRISVSSGFYLPVSILYLERVRGFGLDDIGLIMGVFSVVMVFAEIPTGYIGDRLGRRESLAIGNLLTIVFMGGYVVVESPVGYLALHTIWAFAWAFRSGTAEAWLYELLAVNNDESEFTHVRSRAMTIELGFEAVTATVTGGFVVVVGWTMPFLANAAIAAIGIPVLLTTPTVTDVDDAEAEADEDVLSVQDAVSILRLQARRPEIRWLIAYLALFFGLYSGVRTFEQPALDAVGVPVAGLGLLYGGFKTVSAGAASTANWLSERFGAKSVFGLLVPVYGLAFFGVAVVPALVVPVLFLNRSIRVIVQPIRDQYLNDRFDDVGRATALSGTSMVISAAMGVSKFIVGVASSAIGVIQFLVIAGLTVSVTGAILWYLLSPVRPSGNALTAGSDKASSTD